MPLLLHLPTTRSVPTYMPHPAPTATKDVKQETMGGFATFMLTVVLPAVIALALYLLLSFIIVPLWQRYHGRYSRYLPLETISTQTHSIRERIQDAIARFVMPSSWRQDFQQGQLNMSPGDESDHSIDDDDGEELYELDGNRREALSLDARRVNIEDSGRLSRDLEEGFRDDSDDETDNRR